MSLRSRVTRFLNTTIIGRAKRKRKARRRNIKAGYWYGYVKGRKQLHRRSGWKPYRRHGRFAT